MASDRFVQLPDMPTPVRESDAAYRIRTMLGEMFWLHTNREARTQQVSLGPSEIGEPCEQKIVRRMLPGAMMPNHTKDSWLRWLGTCVHAGLATAAEEYDSGRQRFLIEHRIEIPGQRGAPPVLGTLDLYDRKEATLIDHKIVGERTLNRCANEGPGDKYSIQGQIYGFGLALQGETPKSIAVVMWPRDGKSIDAMQVHVESYSPQIARDALRRYWQLHLNVASAEEGNTVSELLKATPLDPGPLCGYCPFYNKKAADVLSGCRGKDA
jgi:hypothetical protein